MKELINKLGYVGVLCVFAMLCVTTMSITNTIFGKECGCKTEESWEGGSNGVTQNEDQ